MSSALDGAQTSLRARHAWRIHLAGGFSGGDVRRLLTGDSLPEMFSATARREPGRPALLIAGESATHGDLDARAGRVAAWLREHGVRAGDVVIISARASLAMIIGYLGVLRGGALVLLAHPTLTEPELAHLVLDSQAVAALADGEPLIVDVLYGDQEGGQRTVTRFILTPMGEEWLFDANRQLEARPVKPPLIRLSRPAGLRALSPSRFRLRVNGVAPTTAKATTCPAANSGSTTRNARDMAFPSAARFLIAAPVSCQASRGGRRRPRSRAGSGAAPSEPP